MPNSDEARDIESQQRDDGVLEQRGPVVIGARYADEGPAPEVNAAYRIDGRNDVADIAHLSRQSRPDTTIHPIGWQRMVAADDAVDTRLDPAHENASFCGPILF